jgi:hypothetical protein
MQREPFQDVNGQLAAPNEQAGSAVKVNCCWLVLLYLAGLQSHTFGYRFIVCKDAGIYVTWALLLPHCYCILAGPMQRAFKTESASSPVCRRPHRC